MNDIAQERGPLKSESASRDERERQKHSDADEKTEKIKTPERFRGLIPKKLKLAFLAERAVAERADLFNEADWHLEEANVTAAAEAFAQIPLTLDTDWTAQRLKPLFMRKCLARGIAPPVIQRAWTTAVLEAPARRREQERELQKYMRRGAIAARLNEQADDLRIEHEKWKEEMAREAAAAHKDGNGHDYGDTGPGTEHSTRASDTRKPKQRGKQATVEGIAITGGSLSANADEAEAALSKAKVDVYRQRGKHVRPFREKARDSKGNEILIPAIVEVSATYIRDLLSQHSKWKKWDSRLDDWVRKDPPKDVADTIFHRRGESDYWRTLTGVTGTPFLRHDATIAHAPGFDDKTGMFLMEPVQLPADTPDRPTKADAVAPLATLDELLKNFPFVDESEEDEESDSVEPTKDRTVSHAVALSMLLTPIARAALDVAPIAHCQSTGRGHRQELPV